MPERQRYTVLVGYPLGNGHYAKKGAVLELLEVQAHALETAGRIKLTAQIEAEALEAAALEAAAVPTAKAAKTSKAEKVAD